MSPAERRYLEAIDRRDAAAKAAYEREWQRFQHKVEEARGPWLAELRGRRA